MSTPRPLLSLTAALALLAAPACTSESSPWVRPRREAGPQSAALPALATDQDLRVEYGGCATVRLTAEDRLECIYRPGDELRLWVIHEDGQRPTFTMAGDGAWSMGEPYVLPEELGQGYRVQLTEADLGAVTVRLPGRPSWRLALRANTELSKEEKQALAEPRKRFVALEKKLVPEKEGAPQLEIVPQVSTLLRQMVEQGHLWNAIQSGAAAAYHLTWRASRPDLAQELLEELREQITHRLPSFERDYPFGAAPLSIYLGHSLRHQGQLANAAREYRRGARIVRRVRDRPYELDVMAPYALVLAELGYFEAAAYWSAEARELALRTSRPYDLAQILTMVARVSLRLRQARQPHDDPAPRLEEIARIYGPEGPLAKFAEPFDALMSRVEFALLDGDPERALTLLEVPRANPLLVDKLARIEVLWLRGLLLQGADPQTLRQSLGRLQDLATHTVGPEFRWRTTLLEARVHEALGELRSALDAYTRAEALLDQMLPMAALGLPGDFTATRYNEGTARLASLLVEQGELDGAVCTIRRARARIGQMARLHRRLDRSTREALAGPIGRYSQALLDYERLLNSAQALAGPEYESARLLAAQRRQELEHQTFEILSSHGSFQPSLDCEQLAARRPGELLLLLYPVGADLHVFIEDDRGATHYPVLADYFEQHTRNADWDSDLVLRPLRDRILEARRIRVLASGPATAIPVHALPWSSDPRDRDRKPLMSSIPVVYGLDLPPPLASSVSDRGDRLEALVLSDNRADGARQEAEDITAALRRQGWTVSRQMTRGASSTELRKIMRQVDLFHYAGHAYYASKTDEGMTAGGGEDDMLRRWPPYSAGAASEPSYIPVGAGGRLTVPDVLMMERVPDTVVLMGCATGVIDERMAHGGFSLATAFLGAGARAVIASTHEIDGDEVAILGRALYSGSTFEAGIEPSIEPGRWMTNALRSIEAEEHGPDLAIANYRAYVP